MILSTIALYTEIITAQSMLLVVTLGLISTVHLSGSAIDLSSTAQGNTHKQTRKVEKHVANGLDQTCSDNEVDGVIQDLLDPFPKYVSCFRGSLMLGTCCCILAVDFRAFPRRFAKTEEWGYSLMDMGVGGIVLASSCTSATAALAKQRSSKHMTRPTSSIWELLVASTRSSAPCLLLWLVRLASVKAIDYQEHVGEYGVHWNFFATLYFLALLKALVPVPSTVIGCGIMTAAVAVLQQVALSAGGLGPWIRSESRDPGSLLSLNKEGCGSLMGYWALAVAGAWIALVFHHALTPAISTSKRSNSMSMQDLKGSNNPSSNVAANAAKTAVPVAKTEAVPVQAGRQVSDVRFNAGTMRHNVLRTALPQLVAVWVALGLLWYVSDQYVETASRRAANLAYILFVVFSSFSVLLTLLTAHLVLPGGLQSVVSCAASKHMLPVFLIANLLTGLVNVSMDTLVVNDWAARLIVAVYMAVVCSVAVAFDYFGIRLKL